MLTSLLFCLAAQAQAAPAPSAGALISKMFERYYSARTLGGTIHTTQVAGPASVVTDTAVAYERPSKLFLDQRQTVAGTMREKELVSDGTLLHYTPPARIITATPFVHERVKPDDRPAQTVGDLYHIVAADLPDRSPVLDALIAADLGYVRNQLATFHLQKEKETVNGKPANVIEGDWRETEALNVAGGFKLYITDAGDLVRYVLTQSFAPPAKVLKGGGTIVGGGPAGGDAIVVTTTWDADITVDAPLKPGTFTLQAP